METINFVVVFLIGLIIGNLLFYLINKHKEEKQDTVDDDVVFFYETGDGSKIINIEKLIAIQKFNLPPDDIHKDMQYGIEYLLDNNTSTQEFFDTIDERDDQFNIAYRELNQLPIY